MEISNTRDHNVELLKDFGFTKFSNTTVFHKGSLSFISPAVAENTAGGYWFDLRQVNLERLSEHSYLFVRIVPNLFILEPLDSISKLIAPELMDNRLHSGDVWGLGIELNHVNMTANLFNKKTSKDKFSTRLLSLDEARSKLGSLT